MLARPENVADMSLLTEIVREAGYSFSQEGNSIVIDAPMDWAPELNRHATSKGINLRELRPQCESLEDIFLNMTRGEAAV